MQGLRQPLKIAFPIAGTLVAFSGVLFVEGDFATLMTVLAGIPVDRMAAVAGRIEGDDEIVMI